MSTDAAVVPLGGPAVYNVTIGVPYRTVTDIDVEIKSSNDAIQVCLYAAILRLSLWNCPSFNPCIVQNKSSNIDNWKKINLCDYYQIRRDF